MLTPKLSSDKQKLEGWFVEGDDVYLYHNDPKNTSRWAVKGMNHVGLLRRNSSKPPSIIFEIDSLRSSSWPHTLLICCKKDSKCSNQIVNNILRVEIFFEETDQKKMIDFTVPDSDNWMINPFYFDNISNKIKVKISNVTNYLSTEKCTNYSQIYIDNVEIVSEKVSIPNSSFNSDCEGYWSKCDSNCIKTWNMTKPKEGIEGKCKFVDKQKEICVPGDGECPNDQDCKGEWSPCDNDCIRTWRLTSPSTGKGKCEYINGMAQKCYIGGKCGTTKTTEPSTSGIGFEVFLILFIIGIIVGYIINFIVYKEKIIPEGINIIPEGIIPEGIIPDELSAIPESILQTVL
jgi:hypothetical protein